MNYLLYCDGASRGNPGPAASGFIIKNKDGRRLATGGTFLGTSTNNLAEYQAVIDGLSQLDKIDKDRQKRAEVFVDSQLVHGQLSGIFKVKNSQIRERIVKIRQLENNFAAVRYNHIRRTQNKEADHQVNKILDLSLKGSVFH